MATVQDLATLGVGIADFLANPNGSDFKITILVNLTGKFIAIMPHLERSIYNWNWAKYPKDLEENQVNLWVEIFVNAR